MREEEKMKAITICFFYEKRKRKREMEKQKEIKICICCKAEFMPGKMCFYSLCGPCFVNFDNQKMIGRFSKHGVIKSSSEPTSYFEDHVAYVATGACNHSYERSFIKDFICDVELSIAERQEREAKEMREKQEV